MYLAKTRSVPFSEEKLVKKMRQYYRPPRYSLKKKTSIKESAYVKKEDIV